MYVPRTAECLPNTHQDLGSSPLLGAQAAWEPAEVHWTTWGSSLPSLGSGLQKRVFMLPNLGSYPRALSSTTVVWYCPGLRSHYGLGLCRVLALAAPKGCAPLVVHISRGLPTCPATLFILK